MKQDKVDIQVLREPDIKKVQGAFDDVRKEEPLNLENFYIGNSNIFGSEEISNADREFIIDLINKTNFIVNAKSFVEESNASKWKLFILKKKKNEEKKQMSIDDDEKRENASIEYSLMEKVKIKNKFEWEQKK